MLFFQKRWWQRKEKWRKRRRRKRREEKRERNKSCKYHWNGVGASIACLQDSSFRSSLRVISSFFCLKCLIASHQQIISLLLFSLQERFIPCHFVCYGMNLWKKKSPKQTGNHWNTKRMKIKWYSRNKINSKSMEWHQKQQQKQTNIKQ